MSDLTPPTETKEGPALQQSVEEVQGHFPSDTAMQDALSRLTLAGYDRADFSLPDDRAGSMQTPNEGAANPVDDIDKAQLRTMGSSMAGYAGAIAAAGATLATGGAAGVAIAAAAAVGAGTGLAANAVGRGVDNAGAEARDEKAAEGTLILAVRVTSDTEVDEVTAIMEAAGATHITPVERGTMTAGVSSAAWTGG